MVYNFSLIIGVMSILAATFAGPTNSAPCDLAERRAALIKRATFENADLLTTVPRLFAHDGIYIATGALTYRGPDGARAWLERDTLNKTSRARMVTVGGDVSSTGDDGFTYGYLDATRANGDQAPTWYHAYWRRDTNGEWAIAAFLRRRRPEGTTTQVASAQTTPARRCAEPNAKVDTVAIAREIAGADQAFSDAAASGVSAAFALYATADVAKSGKEAAYVYGREAVRQLFEPAPPKGLIWQPEHASAGRGGDLGFTIGVAGPRDGTALPSGAAVPSHYFTIWRRDADGRWRYVID